MPGLDSIQPPTSSVAPYIVWEHCRSKQSISYSIPFISYAAPAPLVRKLNLVLAALARPRLGHRSSIATLFVSLLEQSGPNLKVTDLDPKKATSVSLAFIYLLRIEHWIHHVHRFPAEPQWTTTAGTPRIRASSVTASSSVISPPPPPPPPPRHPSFPIMLAAPYSFQEHMHLASCRP
jgi:hypothetical protein